MNFDIDVRSVLQSIRVPTLIMHRTGDQRVHVGNSRYIAERIDGAKYVELSGNDDYQWGGDTEPMLDEIEEFLTGARHVAEPNRVLATVLFTDIAAPPSAAVRPR